MGKRTDRNKIGRLGYYAPRFWPSWLAVGATWLLAKLPSRVQHSFTKGLTWLAIKTRSSRAKTIRRNIELCFPELGPEELETIVNDNMYSTILMLFDLVNMIWNPKPSIQNRGRIIGEQHFHAALTTDKPLIIVSGHATSFLLGLAKLSEITGYFALYRRMDDPVMEQQLYQRAMRKYPIQAIHRKEIKHMLNKLADKGIVAILPDQDFGPRRSTFIPFFGIETATVTAVPQYAKMANAKVLFASTYREANGHYVVEVEPILEDYPSGDDIADTVLWSDWLEKKIREHPENYFWLHKRFKTRPEGEKKLY